MTTGFDVATEARTWLGTPYIHQGRSKGVGVDCLGVIVRVARDLDLFDYDVDGYDAVANGFKIRDVGDELFDIITPDQLDVGDVLLIAFSHFPTHLAIITSTDPLRILDAHSNTGRVSEYRCPPQWFEPKTESKKARVVRCYRYPGLE